MAQLTEPSPLTFPPSPYPFFLPLQEKRVWENGVGETRKERWEREAKSLRESERK